MDVNKILQIVTEIGVIGILCVMVLVSLAAIDKGGELTHLAFNSGNYVGAGLGMLVILLPFQLLMICVFIWIATSKISSAIRGDDE